MKIKLLRITDKDLSFKKKGFALVASLMIMILLTLIALAMMSLSSTMSRSETLEKSISEARANARMALMLAIGEIQRHSGPDTRITAPADIMQADAPPLTGVWKSWEGTNHEPATIKDSDGNDIPNPSAGRPIAPDYDVSTKKYTVKTQSESNSGHFLTWLVSGANAGQEPLSPAPSALVSSVATTNTIPLLSSGTLGTTEDTNGNVVDNPGQVHVVPQLMKDENDITTGSYAWWASPENQKARLIQPREPRSADIAGWMEMGQSHTVPNPGIFGLESLTADPEAFTPNANEIKPASKAMTLESTKLISTVATVNPQESFHHLSTSATGLLTNTATGGWRKDMSLLTEKWDDIYTNYTGGLLPLFRFSPSAGATSQVPKPTTTNYDPAQANLYPWSEYSTILGYKQPGTYHAASASWASLQSYATSYKNFSYNSGALSSPFIWGKIAKQRESSITSSEIYNHKHRQSLFPQIARFQFLVYAKAEEDVRYPGANPKRYLMNIQYVPVFTLWNPYNLTLEHEISGTLNAEQGSNQHQNFLGFGWRRSPPGAMAVVNQSRYADPDAVPASQYKLFTPGNFQTLDWPNNYANEYDWRLPENQAKGFGGRWIDKRTFGSWLPEGTLSFKPGEVKIFSPGLIDNNPGYGFSGVLRLEEGYDPAAIKGIEFWNRNHWRNPVQGLFTPAGTSGGLRILDNSGQPQWIWFLMRSDRLTQPYRDRAPGNGFSLSWGNGSSHYGGGATMPSGIADEFHNITALASDTQGTAYWPSDEVDEVGYSVAELASGPWIPVFSISFGPRLTVGTGPGDIQNRPTKGVLQNNALAAMVLSDPGSGEGKDHPANNTFDFAYHSLSAGSTITPNLSDSEGYIATGYRSGDGLSRLIMAEIPLRPMASLIELQGWNPRGNNPYPPFQMNLIGNSDATPLIPDDDIVPATLSPSGISFNLMHDDAYCANHMLFDDWFVSSIAPQAIGDDVTKDIETVYKDFLMANYALSNRAYISIAEDQKLSSDAADDRVAEVVNSSDGEGFLKVASRFEVEGMFNINSTSVEAWKALLGHAKNRGLIARYGANGIDSTTPSKDHPITRGAVASDAEAGTDSVVVQFENATEYTGFRSLADAQIEDLAQKIVDQVKLRGPFLSLSEFVNRQLSNDEEMALAGVVQTAINNLTIDPMEELRDPNNFLSDTTMYETDPNDDKLVGVDYAFTKAAEGNSAYGAPGWIRQADVLRPIAPVLSARDDTFTIRAYGESIDSSGTVVAKAWCEAVIKRTRDFCDPSDAADSIEPPASAANLAFGRKYHIMAFRWLNEKEV